MASTSSPDDATPHLLAEAGALGDSARDGAAAAGRAMDELGNALARWFGPYGTHALLTRALAQARRDHPVLGMVGLGAPHAPALVGVADAAQAHGTAAVVDGLATLSSATVALLGRMIGEDLAQQLVERHMEGRAPVAPPRAPEPPPAVGPSPPDVPAGGGGA